MKGGRFIIHHDTSDDSLTLSFNLNVSIVSIANLTFPYYLYCITNKLGSYFFKL